MRKSSKLNIPTLNNYYLLKFCIVDQMKWPDPHIPPDFCLSSVCQILLK